MLHLARRVPFLALSGLLLAGCASAPPPAYRGENFDAESPFVTWSTREPAAACEIGKRALLSQGYQVVGRDGVAIAGTGATVAGQWLAQLAAEPKR